ncbi:winged helix-turn-helix transcriptional regulator [Hymenobacter terrenus]|uniref:winged helix-turn-helix transcriptional regulator n=1 Tax=Hymenobacter terrenus TaxID=1629124 RepID=UPI00061914A5|nr:helix-turn-helix domain-containing protein [Hymenobacter terrenus]
MKNNADVFCPISHAFTVLGGKWKFTIISYLLEGPKRFKELALSIREVSPRMLTLVLKDLEVQGLVTRTVYPEVPPRVVYQITALGETLGPLMAEVRKWGFLHRATTGQ